jgi:hypothetical protein
LCSHLTSPIITVTIAKSKKFHLHEKLLVAESEKFSTELNGSFKEALDKDIKMEDEDPELFGFFVEYIYRNRSILSREVKHHSEYVTLARLYAMGDRLIAPKFQAQCLWRFTESLSSSTPISDESTCQLLLIACTEIPEVLGEDPLRSYIFWFGGSKILSLQKSGMFRQLLCDMPEVSKQLCLCVNQGQPPKSEKPNKLRLKQFAPESEYSFTISGEQLTGEVNDMT